ncbi:hypothetical protein DN412_35615 [Cupriavidus lacunae]|uniref:Uncharacterized protein n=1 Tax=Cupriavidus lacunae TaxID=2666307 RepID=A0A370NJB3_9BURK|nr:hypothetical protein DN412_35615 [Cupriavidus lacunae]
MSGRREGVERIGGWKPRPRLWTSVDFIDGQEACIQFAPQPRTIIMVRRLRADYDAALRSYDLLPMPTMPLRASRCPRTRCCSCPIQRSR